MTKKKNRGKRHKKAPAVKGQAVDENGQAVPDAGFMVENSESDADIDEEDWDGRIDEEDEEEEVTRIDPDSEKEFEFERFLSRFAESPVVRQYARLLKNYKENPARINHYVVRMLKRISKQCDQEPLLYCITLFRSLQDILGDHHLL